MKVTINTREERKLFEEIQRATEPPMGDLPTELHFTDCSFSSRSIRFLMSRLQLYPNTNTLIFENCNFLDGVKEASEPIFDVLGKLLASTHIKNFTLRDKYETVSTKATIAFAAQTINNPRLQSLTYDANFISTTSLIDAVALNKHIAQFRNPRIEASESVIKDDIEKAVLQRYRELAPILAMRMSLLEARAVIGGEGVREFKMESGFVGSAVSAAGSAPATMGSAVAVEAGSTVPAAVVVTSESGVMGTAAVLVTGLAEALEAAIGRPILRMAEATAAAANRPVSVESGTITRPFTCER